ncbi:MAG TPA: hypothetical protein VNZ63_04565 [Verrucomicrobiae bacterium]|jgi:hypothetical protein|nr:hypothetical protein [Verrucomicrobiae bacterium]
MRLSCVVFLLALCAARTCVAEQVTLHGFIVDTSSPAALEFDDFSVTRDNRLSLEINSNPAKSKNTLRPGAVRVGDEVEISGNFDAATHKLTIKTVKVLSVDDRRFKGAAFPDRPPELKRTAAGWNGYVFLDGVRICIADSTHVAFRRNKRELEELQKQQNGVAPAETVSLTAPDEIGLNTMASYAAVGQKDGSVLASRVEFEHFELSLDESKRLQKLDPRIQKGDPLIAQPDELHIGRNKYKLLPSSEAQQYVQKLGESLIPQRQRELPAGGPLKIDYRFYLVEDKEFNVLGFPDGAIVVNSGLLEGLEDEAQLAFHVSRAITQVEEMDAWRLSRYDSNPGHKALKAVAMGAELAPFFLLDVPTLIVASKSDDFVDSLRDQADRLALEWMLAAGYDIREAPRAYKVYALRHPDHKPLYPKPDANQVEKNEWAAARRAFLMTELRTNYSGINYGRLKKDSEQFHAAAKQAHASDR